jgi:non-specific serine/threonine protein kinase
LRATVDYSYDLCTEAGQKLWAQLSVFAGGADMAAIMSVCQDESFPAADVELALSELVEKSVVSFDGARYRMLETIRQYGHERLDESGEEDAIRRKHRNYFAAMADEAARHASPGGQFSLLQRILADHTNLRSALDFCTSEPGEVKVGLTMAARLWPLWTGCGLHHEGRHWLDTLLSADDEPTHERVAALWTDSWLCAVSGALPQALDLASQCEDLARRLGDLDYIAHATQVIGSVRLGLDEVDDGIARFEEAVRLERGVPKPNPFLATAFLSLGLSLCVGDRFSEAERVLDEATSQCEADDDQLLLSWTMLYQGLVAVRQGHLQDAEGLLKEVLTRHRDTNDRLGIMGALEFLGWAALSRGDATTAVVLMGASESANPMGSHLSGVKRMRGWHEENLRHAENKLGHRAFESAYARGRNLDLPAAVSLALGEPDVGEARTDSDNESPLTPRELEVAHLVAAGKSNKVIATELVISLRTAEGHVENILRKLCFSSRAQIAAKFGNPGSP